MLKNFPSTLIIGKEVIYLPKCHSTNDIAADMVRNNTAGEGTVIFSDYQTAGRGQAGNTWESAERKNLTFSVVLSPRSLEADKNFYLNMVITLGIYDALYPRLDDELKIKWPNDINYSRRKLGGILIENTIRAGFIQSSVAGIGINIMQENFRSEKAISMYNVIPTEHDRMEIFQDIVKSIDARYDQLRRNSFEGLRRDYHSVLFRYRQLARFRTSSDFYGRITGVDEYGRLLIETTGKSRVFSMKEIEFLDD